MNTKSLRYLILLLVFLVPIAVVVGRMLVFADQSPQSITAGAPSVVSYQGQVVRDGVPYSGTGYFKFAVVNEAGTTTAWSNDGTSTAGGQPTNAVDLPVQEGVFSVLLGDTNLVNMTPLTASAFSGTDRYLRVWFSPDNVTFHKLQPARRIAAVPYALQAQVSANAQNADTLDTLHASAFQQHYANVVIVAKEGGDFTSIQAALDSITDAGEDNPYLVWIAPGVYTEQVTMKPYVDIEGAGENSTKIVFTGSSTNDMGTVNGANNVELRFLTVLNTGGNTYATAIYNNGTSPMLTHVVANAAGGDYAKGVHNDNASSPEMTHVVAGGTAGAESNYGVLNDDGSQPLMTDVTAVGSGGLRSAGVRNYISNPTMINVNARGSDSSIANFGVRNYESNATMTDVVAVSNGPADNNYGVHNINSSPQMSRVIAEAFGGTIGTGVYNGDSSSPNMTGGSATGTGTENGYGVWNNAASSPTITDLQVSGSGDLIGYGVRNENSSNPIITNLTTNGFGGNDGYGVYNSDSSVKMTNVIANGSGDSDNSYGIRNDSSTLVMIQSTATASNGTSIYGLYNDSSNLSIQNSRIMAGGTVGDQIGIYNTAPAGPSFNVTVRGSRVVGDFAAIYTTQDAPYSTLVGTSQLEGNIVGGVVQCAGVYDLFFDFFPNTCP